MNFKYVFLILSDATLQLFGSFCNGFGFKNKSDMDFCLTFGDRDDGKVYIYIIFI